MSLNPAYNFQEAQLGPKFAQNHLRRFKELIDSSLSFVAVSMPGVGVSYFLKYLVMQDFAYFIHVDLYSLPTLSQHEFYKLLLSELGGDPDLKTDEDLLSEAKKLLQNLSEKQGKIVIIFSRFDQLKDQFDWNFLSNIQSLSAISPNQIILIFTSTKPLHKLAPDALSGGNLNFYSKELYFKPYSKEDLKKLLKVEPVKPISKEDLENSLSLSGGHNQLFHILLNSQKQHNLLLDQFVKLQLKEFVDYLDYHQKKTVQKIALGKKVLEIDEYLLEIGMVKKTENRYELFTPLLTEYIKTNLPAKLPVKEAKLFKLLKNNIGRTVSKDQIFAELWGENNEDATDWALDALIYRLRKHPFIKGGGYIIESQKKVGYTLIQT
ncbi:helix-turn-helix domain-containing protein [Patescibacteria group bacterium]|nr:helix-turn-helix domain-containing protein [Patescibacteria group bacterium]